MNLITDQVPSATNLNEMVATASRVGSVPDGYYVQHAPLPHSVACGNVDNRVVVGNRRAHTLLSHSLYLSDPYRFIFKSGIKEQAPGTIEWPQQR